MEAHTTWYSRCVKPVCGGGVGGTHEQVTSDQALSVVRATWRWGGRDASGLALSGGKTLDPKGSREQPGPQRQQGTTWTPKAAGNNLDPKDSRGICT